MHIIQFQLYHSINIYQNLLQEQFCNLPLYKLVHVINLSLKKHKDNASTTQFHDAVYIIQPIKTQATHQSIQDSQCTNTWLISTQRIHVFLWNLRSFSSQPMPTSATWPQSMSALNQNKM